MANDLAKSILGNIAKNTSVTNSSNQRTLDHKLETLLTEVIHKTSSVSKVSKDKKTLKLDEYLVNFNEEKSTEEKKQKIEKKPVMTLLEYGTQLTKK